MIRLTLVRHAKAEWKSPQISDFDRALTRRGQAEAQALARHLADRQLVPQLLMASPARRTKQTTEILGREFEFSAHAFKYEERLYLATPQEILAVVQSIGPKVRHLLVVGHNPGISELAHALAPDGDPGELDTATAFTMEFDGDVWNNIAYGTAKKVSREEGARRLFGLWA